MIEIWKDIVGFEGKYMVSNLGNVKSLSYRKTGGEHLLKPRINRGGYLQVNLYKDGLKKNYRIHRLVCQAFLDDYSEDLVVNHIDGCKTNNSLDNLEMATTLENNIHAYSNGLNPHKKAVEVISFAPRGNVLKFPQVKVFNSQKEAAEFLETNIRNVNKCVRGINKTCKGHLVEYYESHNRRETIFSEAV